MNTNTKLFKTWAYLLILEAILYVLEIKFYLTWTIWWYDIILHFLAGSILALTTILIVGKFFTNLSSSRGKMMLLVLSVALIVGVMWEIYELLFGITSLSHGWSYITDTASDIFFDLFGSVAGLLYGLKIWIKN